MKEGMIMFLEKENVSLYYEIRGEGEPLLLIHGAVVDAWLYQMAAEYLKKYFTVITFDRRGSSRSLAHEGIIYDLEAQASDVKDILDELKIEQVTIVGASAGAVLGHYFLLKYPERVEKLLMYEPPLVTMIGEDENSKKEWVNMMKDLIARGKYNKALYEFALSIGDTDERAPKKPEDVAMREMQNFYHFLKNEFETFIDYCPDMKKSVELADKIIVAVGEGSKDGAYPTASKKFANLIGKEVLYYPGYHNLPSELPKEFAMCVLGTLLLEKFN